MSLRMCRCGQLVQGRCEKCSGPRPNYGTTGERGYDNKWRVLSERKRSIDPLCESCRKQGVTTAATEVHHIVPIAEDPRLRLVWSNLMSVCNSCHSEIEKSTRNHPKVDPFSK